MVIYGLIMSNHLIKSWDIETSGIRWTSVGHPLIHFEALKTLETDPAAQAAAVQAPHLGHHLHCEASMQEAGRKRLCYCGTRKCRSKIPTAEVLLIFVGFSWFPWFLGSVCLTC